MEGILLLLRYKSCKLPPLKGGDTSDGISSIKFLSRSSNFKLAIVKTELEKPVMMFVLSTKLSVWIWLRMADKELNVSFLIRGTKIKESLLEMESKKTITHQVSPTMQSHVVSPHQHYSYSN